MLAGIRPPWLVVLAAVITLAESSGQDRYRQQPPRVHALVDEQGGDDDGRNELIQLRER